MMRSGIECDECEGYGYAEYEVAVPMSFSVSSGYLSSEWSTCDKCMGLGKVEEEETDD